MNCTNSYLFPRLTVSFRAFDILLALALTYSQKALDVDMDSPVDPPTEPPGNASCVSSASTTGVPHAQSVR
jgi:hypothetical protein